MLNLGLQAAAKTPFASWAASRTEGRIEGMKDVITEPPEHQHSTAGSFACENKKNGTPGSGVLRLLGYQCELVRHSA
jgi:hypothetical protein